MEAAVRSGQFDPESKSDPDGQCHTGTAAVQAGDSTEDPGS